jgi:hypothetical protein
MKEREKITMLLTKKILNSILRDWRVPSIPVELEKELLEVYGHDVVTEEGLAIEYSEQDICEQLRKILRPYEKDTLNLNRSPF